MIVNIGKITSAVNRIADLTSGDKNIPGVLLDLSENLLKVCYTDGHKAFVEHLDVETEPETDKFEPVVVDFTQLKRAIDNCQPSGIIKVDNVKFIYKDNIISVSADQKYEITDEEGNIVEDKTIVNKKMDLLCKAPGSDMKSAILTRMQYDTIFESDITDEYEKTELLDALSRTSVEKGKQIYISYKTQSIFVANQAHVTSVPISKLKVLSQEEQDAIRAELNEKDMFTEDEFKKKIKESEDRIHFSITMPQNIAKSIVGIFGKTSSDNIYLFSSDKFCNMYVDTEDEHIGIWFEMPAPSRAHVGTLERFESFSYKSYQTMFLKDFLSSIIKSALSTTKSEKVDFTFDNVDGEFGLVVSAGSSSASIADTYRIVLSDVVDPTNDLTTKSFSVSLSVFSAMLEQVKTPYIALDIECNPDGSTCLRLAEVDYAKMGECYIEARRQTEKLCKEQNIEFIETETPTPVELKLNYRLSTLLTKQFTMLAKK